MTRYFLGGDIGSTKTHVLIADESGRAVGFGQSGPGNHETVGYPGLSRALEAATQPALRMASLTIEEIAGAGFGVSGFDFPLEKEATLRAIGMLDLRAPLDAVNDTLIGLLAGAANGWGIAVVSGTGCNCFGWDRDRRRVGQVTGGGWQMGENAGASDLMVRVGQVIAHEWTQRGPATRLTQAMIRYAGVRDIVELLHGLAEDRIHLDPAAAPLVFEVAAQGDPVAIDVIRWAGQELGELAKAVIRQLDFQSLEFDVVLLGSMFNGGTLLIEPMRETIHMFAPGAHLVRLTAPPVVGAVLLGMEQAHCLPTSSIRSTLARSVTQIRAAKTVPP